MKFVVTIDTEEDNWGDYTSKSPTLENIGLIPELQGSLDEFQVRPTYLVTYAVANHEKSASILRKILDEGKCEIGAHCHPWNTPPFEEPNNKKNTMLCNLPADLQYKKLEVLHKTISKNMGVEPISFRAGRWGYAREVARNLFKLGYKVDTSITPFTDWTAFHGPDFSDTQPRPYRFSPSDSFMPTPDGEMLEVPATIGFLQKNFHLANIIHKKLNSNFLKKAKLNTILFHLGMLNKIAFNPEQTTLPHMVKLLRTFKAKRFNVVNMFFHSPSLLPGLSPFIRTKAESQNLISRIKIICKLAVENNITFVTLGEYSRQQLL